MAPRKRSHDGEVKPKPETTSLRVTRSMARRTRSSTQRADGNSPATKFMKAESLGKKKKTKTTKKAKVSPASTKKKEKEEDETVELKSPAAEDGVAAKDSKKTTTIVIEHCKQCNSFKRTAIKVKEGLEEGVPDITVVVNPEKPRRGCFEVREEGGEAFISLLDMKRPFTPMKALDLKEVVADIIEKIK